MNSQEWVVPDWVTVKWPDSDPFQPIYSPYVHDSEELFGNPPIWNQPHHGGTPSSFGGPLPISHVSNGTIWNHHTLPRTPSVNSTPPMISNTVECSFSEEDEDEDDREIVSESYKITPENLSSTSKNCYKPAWKSPQEDEDLEDAVYPIHITKRQKLSKQSDDDTPGLNIPPEKPHRRSHRKPSLSIKATQPHTEISTESSSPEMTTSNDSQSPITISKAKKSHNLTEKKYRNRLNGYFDDLLSAIPGRLGVSDGEGNTVDVSGKKVSKGEVLVLALEHIKALEKQTEALEEEKTALADDLERLKGVCARAGVNIIP